MTDADFSVSLHAGVHRSGTTHLQSALAANRATLKAAQIRLWLPPMLRSPGDEIPDRLGFDRPTPEGALPELGQSAKALEGLRAEGKRRLLISEENYLGNYRNHQDRLHLPIYPRAQRHIEALVRALDPVPLDLYLGLREPCGFLRGIYSQILLSGSTTPPALFFLDNGPDLIDWVDLAGRLRAVPGLRGLTVWRYEHYPANLPLLVRRMADLPPETGIKGRDARAHPSLSALAVRKILAEGAKLGSRKDRARLASRIRDELLIEGGHGAFDPFPPEQREETLAAYDAQLAAIAEMEGVTVLPAPPSVAA